MKAQVKKSKAPARAVAKAPIKSASKIAVKTKPVPKVAAKPAPKAVKKAITPVRSAVKPVVKAKPVGKPVTIKKVPQSLSTSKAVKAPAMPVAKAPSEKKSAPLASKKALAKPPLPGAKVAPKPHKPETRLVTKTAIQTLAKPATPLPAKTSAKDAKAGKVGASLNPAPQAPAPAAGLPPRPPLKPGRRSSARIASQSPPPAPMVPTHAPDAAKASYSAMTERVIVPPPQAAAKKDPRLANNWKTKAAEDLSDDEVKSMPDAEYMNDKQMAFFRYKLSVLKQEIHNSAGETTEHLREDTVVVPDPADRATIEEEHALELRTRDRERKLLKKIEQSIARIDSGDYGYCDETGEPIGVARLIARPTANLSLEAQQRRELKQKMFVD